MSIILLLALFRITARAGESGVGKGGCGDWRGRREKAGLPQFE